MENEQQEVPEVKAPVPRCFTHCEPGNRSLAKQWRKHCVLLICIFYNKTLNYFVKTFQISCPTTNQLKTSNYQGTPFHCFSFFLFFLRCETWSFSGKLSKLSQALISREFMHGSQFHGQRNKIIYFLCLIVFEIKSWKLTKNATFQIFENEN